MVIRGIILMWWFQEILDINFIFYFTEPFPELSQVFKWLIFPSLQSHTRGEGINKHASNLKKSEQV